jgi:SAM-dependent methyltransferase
MNDFQELLKILDQVGPQNIWRPVYGPGNQCLAEGVGDIRDGLPDNMKRFDFRNRTVVDLGCNFGFYTFLVGRAGAAHVTGIDIDGRVIEGCRILKRLFQADNVSFIAADVANPPHLGPFDIGMMIDFIGKAKVLDGSLRHYLDALENLSRTEMIISLRPAYKIANHLNNDFHGLRAKYPETYVGEKVFRTLDYVRDRFRDRWEMTLVEQPTPSFDAEKATVQFLRKTSG